MFKTDDIVTIHLERNTYRGSVYRYRITVIDELRGTVEMKDVDRGCSVGTLLKNIKLDTDYMRKQKLKRICSKLEI